MSYVGSAPSPSVVQFSTLDAQSFNGDGSTTAFTLNRAVSIAAAIEVTVNNVQQSPYDGSYTVNGTTTLTFSEAPSSGTDNIYVRFLDYPLASITPGDGTVGLDQLSATGTPSSSTFLRGDNSWQTVSVTPTAVSDQANSSTGYFDLPAGTTAQRPASPAVGMIRYNTTESEYEVYTGADWELIQTSGFPYTVEYLVVAGGGGGGSAGGGGGAGGLRDSSVSVSVGTAYTVTIGAGGAGGGAGANRGGTGTGTVAASGSNSVFGAVTSTAGGAGASEVGAGASGGSGGGGTHSNNTYRLGYSGTAGQGSAGGDGADAGLSNAGGGGGGGASAVGGSASGATAGNGGAGTNWKSLGTTYAGGGGGGVRGTGTVGSGGSGGGGAGASSGTPATSGTANTGGGGGGGGHLNGSQNQGAGGAGGSGIVIIRYSGSQRGSGGTVTSSGGYTYHTFTTSGTYTA